MKLAHITNHPPHLVSALQALALRSDNREAAQILLDELSGITVLVAKKFTNERTADGLLEALQLTVGCISLGISQANIPQDSDAKLTFLLHHGAEYVFQMGFRHIKELSGLPYTTFVSEFDDDPFVQQRDIKVLFAEICRADPDASWTGDATYQRELQERQHNHKIVACAKWLRQRHYAGPVKDPDLDAHAVIAIAVIFAIAGDAPIVARGRQKDFEALIQGMRKTQPDIDAGWGALLKKVPSTYHPILRESMDEYRNTIVKKIQSKTGIKAVLTELQNSYA
ncbi:MAG: hypothetical protein OEV31_08835, partial [Gammaproteobacteria bacterium]|nr:hypothetical protein [Gammaproteobacteria bacterium]